MSFQGYLKTIKEKTGLEPGDFRNKAEEKHFTENGLLRPEVKAGEIVSWLKKIMTWDTDIQWPYTRF